MHTLMFKNNKYTKIYYQIINRAKDRPRPDEYVEKHHIIPKCLGGTNESDNLAVLTAREHFVCHLLLTKMHDTNKLKYALVMLTLRNQYHTSRYILNSRQYEFVKRCNSKATTDRLTGATGHALGIRCYYNTVTGEEQYSRTPPSSLDWVAGSPSRSKRMMGIHLNRVYYYHPDTNNVISLHKDASPPVGYVKGNPNADTSAYSSIKGSKYYYNPITKEERRMAGEIPPDWYPGRAVMFITDGKTSILINKWDTIPTGFKKGRYMDWKRNSKLTSQKELT